MGKLFRFAMILFLLFPTLVLAGDPVDITGDWRIHTTSHKGYETWETKILAFEGKYKAITIHPYLGRSESTIMLDGDAIKMMFNISYGAPGTETVSTTFEFVGTVENDTMRGSKTTLGANTHGDDKPVSWVALKKPASN